MNAAQLLADLARLGIRLEAHGDRLRYLPRSSVTPDLAQRMKAHKGGLLAMLRPKADALSIDPADPTAVWQAALDRLEGDPLFPPDVMEALRAAHVRWTGDDPSCEPATEPAPESLGRDGWPADRIDPNEMIPCPKCGTLELWQSVAGDLFGVTPGRWRCMTCDPPTTATRLAELAGRIRRRTNRVNNTRQNG